MQTMLHPVHRPFKMPAWPVRVDGKATRVTASPMLGQHTDQVLSDWLGLNAPAVAALKSEGVVCTGSAPTRPTEPDPDSPSPTDWRCAGGRLRAYHLESMALPSHSRA